MSAMPAVVKQSLRAKTRIWWSAVVQRSALFGALMPVLWTDQCGRQTNFEYAGAGDARHIYTRLQFALDDSICL